MRHRARRDPSAFSGECNPHAIEGATDPASSTTQIARKVTGGARAGRMGAAEQRSFWAGARTRALRHLTCPILFERNERSE
jgi:hypothetical protein